MKQTIALIVLLAYGASAFATADFDPSKYQSQTTKTTTQGSSAATTETGGKSTTTSGNPVQASINPGAQTGKNSQSGGAGANAAAGAMLIASGVPLLAKPPTVPQGVMLIGMGILALLQAKEDKKAAGESAATGYASNTNGSDTDTTPQSNDAINEGSAGNIDAKIKEGQAKLAEAGYKMTESGLVKPDGSVIPASSFNSAAGMAAAGMSPATIAEAEKILAQAEGIGPKVSGVDVAGGGGGSAGEAEGGSSDSAAGDGGRNPFALGDKDKAGLVAGKTVMFDGEPIGVRGQNIFAMVHNCYQKKRAGNHFIEVENDPNANVSVRSPASVVKPASVRPAPKK